MKHLAPFFVLLAVLFNACSTDFDVTADYEETMVVYGLMDASKDTQYIRISRGYISEDRSALEIAKEPDSIYYLANQLDVSIVRQSDGARLTFTEDLTTPKDSGEFAQAPHLLYMLPQKLNAGDSYRLEVKNNVTGKFLSATTPMVDSFRLTQPSDVLAFPFTTNLVTKLPNGNPQPVEVNFTAARDGKVYDVAVRFYYREWEGAVSGPGTLKYVEYVFERNLVSTSFAGNDPNPGTQNMIARYTGEELFIHMASVLSKNPNITRAPIDLPIEYIYYAGAESFYDLLRSSLGASGITALEARPIYSNIEGGYGLFSSRFSKNRPQVGINPVTKDSLACGRYTRDLNFVVDVPTSCN